MNLLPRNSILVGEYREVPPPPANCATDPSLCPDVDPGSGSCSAPSPSGNTLSGEDLSPNAVAELLAEMKGSPEFDVSEGIPAGESLYTEALAKEWLSKFTFTEYEGECSYDIVVSKEYNLEWRDEYTIPGPKVYDSIINDWVDGEPIPIVDYFYDQITNTNLG